MHRADRRLLFHNRAKQAFLELIKFDLEWPISRAKLTPPKDLSVNVLLQYIGGMFPRASCPFIDSLHHIVETFLFNNLLCAQTKNHVVEQDHFRDGC